MVKMVARLPRRLTRKRSDMRTTSKTDTTLQEAGSEHSESLRMLTNIDGEVFVTAIRGEHDQVVEITQPESVQESVAGF